MTREICKNCGKVSPLGFTVPDSTWKYVVPTRYHDSNLCIMCFAMYGDEKGTDWDFKIDFYPVSLFTHRAACGTQ